MLESVGIAVEWAAAERCVRSVDRLKGHLTLDWSISLARLKVCIVSSPTYLAQYALLESLIS